MTDTREFTAEEWLVHGPDICRYGSVVDWDEETAAVTAELFKNRGKGVRFNVPTPQFADELINRLPRKIWPRVAFLVENRSDIGPVFQTTCPRVSVPPCP